MIQTNRVPFLLVFFVATATEIGVAAVVTLEPVIDGVQQRTGFPFPVFTYTSAGASLESRFSQAASHANVFVTELKFAMEFDLSSLPMGVVQSAELSWTELSDFLSPGNTHPLIGFVGDGVLNGSDFVGPEIGQVASGVSDGRVVFDVTSYTSDRVAAGNPFVGFAVINGGYYTTSSGPFSSVTTVGTYAIASRLNADLNARPRLRIAVVPELSGTFFIALGLASLPLVLCANGETRRTRTHTNRIQ